MGAPKGNKNAKGHGAPKGNKNALGFGAPYGNTNARKHGLFEKYWSYIPPDKPENKVIFEALEADGVEPSIESFNAYKKLMHDEVREALQRSLIERNGKRYISRARQTSKGKIKITYYEVSGNDETEAEDK